MFSTRFAGLLRRHGWWANLGFIALTTYFLARAASAVVAGQLQVIPSVDDRVAQPSPGSRAQSSGPLQFSAIAERNLFGLKRESLRPVEGETAVVEHQVSGRKFKESELQPCGVNAVVRATLVADDPEHSIAVILEPLSREPKLYTVGEGHNQVADDAVLVAVRHREVVLRRRDHFELCKGEGETASSIPTISLVPTVNAVGMGPNDEPADPNPSDTTGVVKLSETDYRVERAEVDRVLANLNEVAMQARVIPSFKNGKPNGFKMMSIKAGSIYAKIGLQNGDVIQKINGFEMNGVDRALEVFAKLREATSLVVDIQRHGDSKTLSYVIH